VGLFQFCFIVFVVFITPITSITFRKHSQAVKNGVPRSPNGIVVRQFHLDGNDMCKFPMFFAARLFDQTFRQI
jgi:hypothetical protein